MIGVVTFPGSNCDRDCVHVLRDAFGQAVRSVWHEETSLKGIEAVILPGGFSYGDYLRTGAIARFSPVMAPVKRFAEAGGLVLGICNGFQILLESGLLPGAMLRNTTLTFICREVYVRVDNTQTPFTRHCRQGQVLRLPIAHADGNYYTDPDTLEALRRTNRIVLRYCTDDGEMPPNANPNGSLDHIAGLCNDRGNVFGLMPHPERCAEAVLGNEDGRMIFRSMLDALRTHSSQAVLC